MVSRSPVTVAVALGVAGWCLLPAAPAAADDWSLHGTFHARLGWTDNLFSAPSESTPDTPQREADFYGQLIPGGLFTWETQRMIHELLYELEGSVYLDHSEANSLTHRASWRSFWLTSPNSEMSTSLNFAAGSLNTFSTVQTAQSGQPIVLPSATNTFASVEARELFNLQLTRAWRFSQMAVGRYFTSEDPDLGSGSAGVEIGGSVGLDRAWQYNAVGGTLQATLVSLDHTAGGVETDGPDQVNTSLGVQWRRDLSLRWNSLIDGGLTALVPLDEGDQLVVQPTVGAQIGYTPDWGHAGVSVRRAVASNLYIAENTISDTAAIFAGLPLPWLTSDPRQPTLSVDGSLGIGRTAIIDSESGATDTSFNVLSADAAVNYAMQPQLVFSLRYQYLRQMVDEGSLDAIYDYDRHTVLLTFAGRWPSRVAAEVPLRATLRVDRSDVTPVGDEPVGGSSGGGAP